MRRQWNKKKKVVVFVTYINWAVVKEGTIYCPVHGHLQVNDRRTTQTRIGQVIANRQALENKSVLKAMGWLRYQSSWLVRGVFWNRIVRYFTMNGMMGILYRMDFVLDDQGIVFRSLAWQEICLFCKSSIPAVHCLVGTLLPRLKRPGCDASCSAYAKNGFRHAGSVP